MPDRVDVDTDGLRNAADILADLRDDFADISAKAERVMGNMSRACGDDHFGHQFTDGSDGYRGKCESAVGNVDAFSESFDQYSLGIGGSRGAAAATEVNDEHSGNDVRRAV
ncbi:hypothetical protein AB0M34_00965 [Nocardia sp. NPDC050193]